ncbi:MAG TPA: serine hydrolase domain-containing protein [Acidimicrobiia bacterium]|nr:serine hydrolase domain-containing protein [Acidimicrobiia bacterium]
MTSPIALHPNIDAIAVIEPGGNHHYVGSASGRYAFASVTKLLTTHVIADAVSSGFIFFEDDIDDPYFDKGGVTLADLMSHASGVRPELLECVEPRQKRIYTNEAFHLAGDFLIRSLGDEFRGTTIAQLFKEGLGAHLSSTIEIAGSCASSASGTLDDLVKFLGEMRSPTFLDGQMHELLTTPYCEDLAGILPGWGHYVRNLFGIGYEIKGEKSPHWSGPRSSSSTFGHFGQSGAFVFHDPVHLISVACVTNESFGPWAKEAYPQMCDEIYERFS